MHKTVLRIVLTMIVVLGRGGPAWADFAAGPQAAHALGMGVPAPAFTASRVDGSLYHFRPDSLAKPVVLIFYRGGWCPYCNMQLADMHRVEPRLRAAGFEILFVSTDRRELLYSSLKEPGIQYTLLSDPALTAAQAFHIAYHLDDAAYAEQLKWGVNLEKTTGTTAHALPVRGPMRKKGRSRAPSSVPLD